ncbi:MAG: hypothetical protein AAGC63_17140 [Propionicimonas sp.]
MTLLDYLRADLKPLMKRRDRVALNAVRSAIAAIENAEVSYLSTPATVGPASEFVAGAVHFGCAERVVRELTGDEMMAIATAEATRRLDEADRLRRFGRVDQALTLKAEALTLQDRLAGYAAA